MITLKEWLTDCLEQVDNIQIYRFTWIRVTSTKKKSKQTGVEKFHSRQINHKEFYSSYYDLCLSLSLSLSLRSI